MVQPTDYRAQAARCRAEAEAATLDNVRDQRLRAEAAWIGMAQRHERVADARAARATPASTPGEHDILPEPA